MGFSLNSLFDPLGLFKKGETKEVADPYGGVRNSLNSWLTSNLGKAGPSYTGEMVAPMSEQEKSSLGKLEDYSKYDLSKDQTFQNAKSEINKTLTNQYDPTTSPYYQAVKAEAARNLDQTNKQIASQAAGGGRYFSGSRQQQQREAGTDVNIAMDKLMGSMAENERARRLTAVPMAQSISQQEMQLPFQQATALQTLGALPRTIAQAKDQASLEDWLRSNYEYPLAVANIGAGVQSAPLYEQSSPGLLAGLGLSLPWSK